MTDFGNPDPFRHDQAADTAGVPNETTEEFGIRIETPSEQAHIEVEDTQPEPKLSLAERDAENLWHSMPYDQRWEEAVRGGHIKPLVEKKEYPFAQEDENAPEASISALPVERIEQEPAEPICFATDDPELIHKARILTATVYLGKGYISADQVGEDGTVSDEFDPYKDHSTYYVLMQPGSDKVIATCRKIKFDPAKGENSFPLLNHKDELDSSIVEQVYAYGLENVAEISALVRDPKLDTEKKATLQLYRKVLQDSWSTEARNKTEMHLMANAPHVFNMLENLFGGAVRRAGDNIEYPGQEVIPCVFNTIEGATEVIEKGVGETDEAKAYTGMVDFFFEGSNGNKLDKSLVKALKSNGMTEVLKKADYSRKSRTLERLKGRKPELIASLGLLAYTAARTAAVSKGISPHTGVDWHVFLGIEVGTTPQYAYGMGTLARSAIKPEDYTTGQRVRAAALAGSALVAPYAYIIDKGQGMPPEAVESLAGLVLVGGLLARKSFSKAINAFRRKPQIESIELQEP